MCNRPRKKPLRDPKYISVFTGVTMDDRELDSKEAQLNGDGTRQIKDKSRGKNVWNIHRERFVGRPNQRCGLLIMTIYIVVCLINNWNWKNRPRLYDVLVSVFTYSMKWVAWLNCTLHLNLLLSQSKLSFPDLGQSLAIFAGPCHFSGQSSDCRTAS